MQNSEMSVNDQVQTQFQRRQKSGLYIPITGRVTAKVNDEIVVDEQLNTIQADHKKQIALEVFDQSGVKNIGDLTSTTPTSSGMFGTQTDASGASGLDGLDGIGVQDGTDAGKTNTIQTTTVSEKLAKPSDNETQYKGTYTSSGSNTIYVAVLGIGFSSSNTNFLHPVAIFDFAADGNGDISLTDQDTLAITWTLTYG